MAFNDGGGQQAPMFGDPNDPSSFHPAVPRFVPLTVFDTPVRPESSASNESSSSGFASQVSYDGGVALPPASVASSSNHGRRQQQQHPVVTRTANTGATNAQVQGPLPVRIISNNIITGAAHANPANLFPSVSYTAAPTAYRSGPNFSAPQPTSYAYINGTGVAKVNISKNDRIYGNLRDNQPGNLSIHGYGNGFGNARGNALRNTNNRIYGNGNGIGNSNISMSARTYANGITRRSRGNHIHGASQAIAGGFNNTLGGSRYQPGNYNEHQQYPVNRVLFQGPPNNNQFMAYRAQIPHQAQFPNPLTMFNAPPDPFAGPGRVRSVAMADYIRSGALDDGQSLDPDARTPTAGSDRRHRRRTNSMQFTTPTRSRRNGYGSTPSNSNRSSEMTTPSRNMRSYGTPTLRTPVNRLLHGQTLPPPAWLHVVCSQQPTLDEALTSLPFSNPYKQAPVRGLGVVKFINIPYGTLRSELVAALGRSARPVNMPRGSPYYAVHIVMDRNTGKTGDGFVELPTIRDALNTVRAINRRATDGSRALKIGNREVTVSVATPDELMAALFPHATTVEWTGYTPRVIDVDTLYYPGFKGIGFTGFCGNEELAMLVKFAENPSRSPFVQRTPQRLYECIISTLYRLPWHTPQYVSLVQRKKLYDTVRVCVSTLLAALEADECERHVSISDSLLQELATAALSCPGFSEQQKASLVEELAAHGHMRFGIGCGMNVHLGGSGMFSASWPFLALAPTAFVNSELLKYYISLISKASEVEKNTSLYDMAAHLELDPKPFGRFAIDYYTDDMINLSLDDIAKAEHDAVARALASVLLGGCSGPIYELE